METASHLDSPPYSRNREDFAPKYRAYCNCRAVMLEACADPVDAKLCHCKVCQRLHGAPFQWAVIFHKRDIRFTKGADLLHFYNSEENTVGHTLPCKVSCSICRSPLADEGRRMFLAFGPLFEFGIPPVVPESFKHKCHIFYATRVVDVNDDKPKYIGHKVPFSYRPKGQFHCHV